MTGYCRRDRGCLAGQTSRHVQQIAGQSARYHQRGCAESDSQNVPRRAVDDEHTRTRPRRLLARFRGRRDSCADSHHVRHGVHARSRRSLIIFRIRLRGACAAGREKPAHFRRCEPARAERPGRRLEQIRQEDLASMRTWSRGWAVRRDGICGTVTVPSAPSKSCPPRVCSSCHGEASGHPWNRQRTW